MTIQWYPGHMAKATRQIKEQLKNIDLVIEIVDSRIPLASANPDLQKIIGNLPKIKVLNKKDKSDPIETKKWLEYFNNDSTRTLAINSNSDNLKKLIPPLANDLLKDKIDRQIKKGIKPTAIRTLVVGIPNVGKSTFINHLVGRNVAISADKPGVTKSISWIKTDIGLALIDTPGLLWPKFEDQTVGYRLAVTGAIKQDILPLNDVCNFALEYLIKEYPDKLKERYNLKELENIEIVFENIARNRGLLSKNNEINSLRTQEMILKEIREDKLGKITWEKL